MILSRVYILSFIIFATPSAVNANTILIMGDSLSAAYGIELKQGWVNLLQNKLKLEQTGGKSGMSSMPLSAERLLPAHWLGYPIY